MAMSFENDIRPLFRALDIRTMLNISGFDLSKLDDVKKHANAIHARLKVGDMPCDAPWSDVNVEKFRTWMEEGMQP